MRALVLLLLLAGAANAQPMGFKGSSLFASCKIGLASTEQPDKPLSSHELLESSVCISYVQGFLEAGLPCMDGSCMAARKLAAFRLYDLRHTWATRAAEAGIDLVTLAAMMGHSRIQMVMRYAHPTQGHQSSAMSKLEAHNAARAKTERQANAKKAKGDKVTPIRRKA
jgi:hypothetical protein